jgi:hypothetical protein
LSVLRHSINLTRYTPNASNQTAKKRITIFSIHCISHCGFHCIHDIYFFCGKFIFGELIAKILLEVFFKTIFIAQMLHFQTLRQQKYLKNLPSSPA